MSKDKLHQIIFWIAGFFLLAYSTTRAISVPMTIDEATTFLVYVQVPIKDVFINNPVNTNNHFLNTLLIRLSTWILGDSDFSVRLPALIGHLLYIIFSLKLIRAISNNTILIISGIVLLHFNPYFMDFFGLARGYSLSWGLMMGSMFYFYSYVEERKDKYISWSFILAGLSVYSILIALNYFLALIAAFNFIFIIDFLKRKNTSFSVSYLFKKNVPAIFTSIVLFALLAYPISRVRANNEFYGEKGSFFNDSILSLINQSLFGKSYFGTDFPLVLVSLAIIVYLSVLLFSFKKVISKDKNNIFTGGLSFGILFTVACWSTIAQFHLLGTPFLADRTALIYFPLFSIIPVFFFSFFDKMKKFQTILCIIPIVAYSYHFYHCANTFTVREWWFDTNTKEVITFFLENENPKKKVTFGISSLNSPSFHYYEKTWQLKDKVDMIRLDQFSKNEFYDYYYIEENSSSEISFEKYDVIKKFDSRILLRLKPKN